ncbi:MAG TPA: PadR family transcriptional regulator [Mycobacteriales bacterium]|nr:PadR family transcriptional regulator [Mycobacteriales bacterium]
MDAVTTSAKQSTLNSTAAALLGLLHDGPKTGGELVAAATERFGTFWTLTRSQVYRELPALASSGYVKLGKTGPRSAQPYSITASGKKAFSGWLAEPAGQDHSRNPVLLRLGFGAHHSKTQLRRLVADAQTEHEQALVLDRQRLSDLRKDGADPHLVATAEFGVAYERAMLKWLGSLEV